MNTMVLEFGGKDYEVKYTFGVIRRMRKSGLDVLGIYRRVLGGEDDHNLFDFSDEVAEAVAILLQEAGAKGATGEEVWRQCIASAAATEALWGVFMWIMGEHMGASDAAPKAEGNPKN